MPRSAAAPLEQPARCLTQTRAELRRLKATSTPEGQAAIALAAAIDSGRALMAAPAMVKELRATLDAVRERAVAGSVDSVEAVQTSIAEKLKLVR